MSLEPTLLREYNKEKRPAKWCVYYEIDTGDVVTVTNREKDFIKQTGSTYKIGIKRY